MQLVSWASRRGDCWGLSWRQPDTQVLPEKPPMKRPTLLEAPGKGTPKTTWANESRKMQAFPLRFPASYLPAAAWGRKNPFIC